MKKALIGMALTFFGVTVFGTYENASAAAWDGQAENQVVSKEENKKTIDYLQQIAPEALENSPVPIENLTQEKPQGEVNYEAARNSGISLRAAAKKWYNVDRFSSSQYLIVSNYLVPVGYNDAQNGIPIGTVDMYQKRFCIPQTSRAEWSVASAGGYGTGGYWWTLFRATENTTGKTKNIWLSAWNLNHLVYG
ncbi:hypothetical protein FKY96_14315 [Enterococcus faecalis]|uniref:hypothetical protein n=1 Tax=Enterococcus faecalis TaxID=1351 RepID=UPI000CF20AE7|nr:hypothetical protein [Enterococcus faecalis]MBJ0423184.1 hypothetical protein [Enterococcus faecalis]MBP4072148.1 hypothetical protein [Enterococcus faecalis]NSW09595.1 hypothetical protein [Enterococcus faecalis]PQF58606.1 hypothetical protein CUS76_02715 [Enterococcus faecalis]TQB31368.1 hypothetical protein FKY96_14315 [Enterococcus faecalis]